MIYHQKEFGMTRADYDKLLADASSTVDHDNKHTDTVKHPFDHTFGMASTWMPDPIEF